MENFLHSNHWSPSCVVACMARLIIGPASTRIFTSPSYIDLVPTAPLVLLSHSGIFGTKNEHKTPNPKV